MLGDILTIYIPREFRRRDTPKPRHRHRHRQWLRPMLKASDRLETETALPFLLSIHSARVYTCVVFGNAQKKGNGAILAKNAKEGADRPTSPDPYAPRYPIGFFFLITNDGPCRSIIVYVSASLVVVSVAAA